MGRKRTAGKNGRDSIGKRLGLKRSDGQFVKAGEIILRQRGTRLYPGFGVGRGGDDTLFAKQSGYVRIRKSKSRRYVDIIQG
jgi:large subunit ribosomal protein L27